MCKLGLRRSEWILECIKQGRRLNESNFRPLGLTLTENNRTLDRFFKAPAAESPTKSAGPVENSGTDSRNLGVDAKGGSEVAQPAVQEQLPAVRFAHQNSNKILSEFSETITIFRNSENFRTSRF